ncbi:acetyl/propionyl/methylcrotonyl-CoA carboxylase subunit alpha [Devosia sp.]|uniref:acetyl/propionyl/methylcrotonyl-CoA carboxylase subunit alpha n=1 Tax=Devosia sp. TaxID=1871048 RepID=UPI002F0E918F
MIGSLLIANRGEIACRIMRTARRLGIRTVAVYSDADAGALHAREADAAVRIGPAAAAESYLDGARLIAAARAAGADAIHPGYGFLSENAGFAQAVLDAGLVWVGPPPAAIAAMGSKDTAKRLMQQAGVATVPGYMGNDQSPARLAAEAAATGYSVLIKAVAGGGGKGMRKVEREEDFSEALAACRREAQAAFGNPDVLIEKWIDNPRHIEVQVFGDTHGRVVHLFERDCSMQRRHQKVIEEAPAPGMDAAVRQAICAAAVRAAEAVDYVGAGTVEFIADAGEGLRADRIWFLEMNTRLQVEHPVTEAITGVDLVEWQLRVAAGEPLPRRQEELGIDGWAMEARLYAEDPARGFLPSVGRIERFAVSGGGVRVDAGVAAGDSVGAWYDPLLAKLIAHWPTRAEAIAALRTALADGVTGPLVTNAGFLHRLLGDADFAAARLDTGLIARHAESLATPPPPGPEALRAAATQLLDVAGATPWSSRSGFRLNAPPECRATLVDQYGRRHAVDIGGIAGTNRPEAAHTIHDGGEPYVLRLARTDAAPAADSRDGLLRSPMSGRIIAVPVAPGDRVAAGQVVAVVEAMKMELALTAPFAGTVAEVGAAVADQVEEGALLVRLDGEEG